VGCEEVADGAGFDFDFHFRASRTTGLRELLDTESVRLISLARYKNSSLRWQTSKGPLTDGLKAVHRDQNHSARSDVDAKEGDEKVLLA
jgi:hypothetical protein